MFSIKMRSFLVLQVPRPGNLMLLVDFLSNNFCDSKMKLSIANNCGVFFSEKISGFLLVMDSCLMELSFENANICKQFSQEDFNVDEDWERMLFSMGISCG